MTEFLERALALLSEQEKRAEAATKGPWHWRACGEKSNDAQLFTAVDLRNEKNNYADQHPPGALDLEVYDEESGEFREVADVEKEIAARDNDAHYPSFNFTAHARTDLPRDVRLLRALLAFYANSYEVETFDDHRDPYSNAGKVLAALREFVEEVR